MKIRVKVDQQFFDVEVGSLDDSPIQVTIDGETFEAWPEEPIQSKPVGFVPFPGPYNPPETAPVMDKTKTVLAPIPGVVLAVLVKPGDKVVFGQELCVLEAMKMKNQIRANRAGAIAAVQVAAGDQVRHGQVLIEYVE